MRTIAQYMYLNELELESPELPFSEAYYLVSLYRTACNKGFFGLADAALIRLTDDDIQLSSAEDIQSILYIAFLTTIGTSEDDWKRRTDLLLAIIEKFWKIIWNTLPEEDLEQWCRDSKVFANVFLRTVACGIMLQMKDQGLELEGLD